MWICRLSTLGRSAQTCPGRAAMEEIELARAEISCLETSTSVARRPRRRREHIRARVLGGDVMEVMISPVPSRG